MASAATMAGKGLQIGIVGAGVAGLSAAIAMRRIGHQVEVSSGNFAQKYGTLVFCEFECHREAECY